MTLSTKVAIRLPAGKVVPPRQMFDVAVECLLKAAGETHEDIKLREGDRCIGSVLGQGLPAIVDVKYEPDGPYAAKDLTNRERYPEDYEGDDEYGDKLAVPACVYLLDFDTAYGYRDEQGNNCNALHAMTIHYLQEWVTQRDGSLMWQDEYSGDWWNFGDVEGWERFIGNGIDSQEWFTKQVKPFIVQQLAKQ